LYYSRETNNYKRGVHSLIAMDAVLVFLYVYTLIVHIDYVTLNVIAFCVCIPRTKKRVCVFRLVCFYTRCIFRYMYYIYSAVFMGRGGG